MGRYSPWRHLRELAHITLTWTDDDTLLDGAWGWYYDRRKVILLDSRLDQTERRSVLAHELAHVMRGDIPVGHWAADEAQEAAADQWAARQLIELSALAETVKWTDNVHEAAEELWVTPDLLETRLKHLHPSERACLKRALESARQHH